MRDSGLVVGTSGNVSARTPDGNVLVTPSGLDYWAMVPEDVVLVDLDGVVVEGSFEPSVEWPMHTGIYRARPETGGIVHTHARYSTTLACLNREIPPSTTCLPCSRTRAGCPSPATPRTEPRSSGATPPMPSGTRTRPAC